MLIPLIDGTRKGVKVTATTGTANADLTVFATRTFVVTNLGTVMAFVMSGLDSAPPTVDDTAPAIPPGASRLIKAGYQHNRMYAKTSTGTSDLQIVPATA